MNTNKNTKVNEKKIERLVVRIYSAGAVYARCERASRAVYASASARHSVIGKASCRAALLMAREIKDVPFWIAQTLVATSAPTAWTVRS